jgi:plastocyanin
MGVFSVKYLHFSLALILSVALVGCGSGEQGSESAKQMKDVPFETTYTIEIQDGSKVFTPESRTVKGNTGKITVKNTLDAPHGFKIADLGIEKVVDANATTTINVDTAEPGEYTIDCQLHSAHKHGKLTVKSPS